MFSQNLIVSVFQGEMHCLLERLFNPQHAEGLESPDNFFHTVRMLFWEIILLVLLLFQNNFKVLLEYYQCVNVFQALISRGSSVNTVM